MRSKTGIENPNGLKGRRVSLEERGLGALVVAQLILRAYGLDKADAHILPLTGKPIKKLLASQKFFSRDEIPADLYGNAQPIPTVSVNALWVVPESADEELIYQIMMALWSDKSR